MSGLRLVKVVCQAHFVWEDEDGMLSERVAQPVEIPARDWQGYAAGAFAEQVERLEAEMREQIRGG